MADIFNKFLVGSNGKMLSIGNLVRREIAPDDAILLAAWLVAMAAPDADEKFNALLREIREA